MQSLGQEMNIEVDEGIIEYVESYVDAIDAAVTGTETEKTWKQVLEGIALNNKAIVKCIEVNKVPMDAHL